jgi:FkbM family methyltransferase
MNVTAHIRSIAKRILPRVVGDIVLKNMTLFLVNYYQRKLKQKIHIRKNTSDINVFAEIFLFKDYNYDLPITPRTIIDAGANVGYASLWFRNKFPNASLIAIEPEKSNFELLSLNTQNIENILLLKKGLWFKSTTLEIINKEGSKYGFITKEVPNAKNGIKTCTVSDLLQIFKETQGIREIDILKIDIEGAEKEVFSNGVENWLNKTKIIIIELHEQSKPGCTNVVLTAIKQYGFELLIEKGENLVYINKALI